MQIELHHISNLLEAKGVPVLYSRAGYCSFRVSGEPKVWADELATLAPIEQFGLQIWTAKGGSLRTVLETEALARWIPIPRTKDGAFASAPFDVWKVIKGLDLPRTQSIADVSLFYYPIAFCDRPNHYEVGYKVQARFSGDTRNYEVLPPKRK